MKACWIMDYATVLKVILPFPLPYGSLVIFVFFLPSDLLSLPLILYKLRDTITFISVRPEECKWRD